MHGLIILIHFTVSGPYLPPPVLLGVPLSVLDHVLDVVFTETS